MIIKNIITIKYKLKMKTNVLVIGDPHFMVTNIPEVELFIERIEKLAIEKTPDFIVILGDVLHTHERLHTTPLNKAYEFIDKMRNVSKTFVLVGNHDMISNQNYLNENHWMNGMKSWNNVTIVDKVIKREINDKIFVFSPYVPVGRFEEALNTLDYDWKNSKCIFAHQEFYGCKMGAIVSVEGDKWNNNYPEIISGHIHSMQKPYNNVYYPGASMQHAFGESKKNVIPFITFSSETNIYELSEIDLELPRKKIIYMDVNDIDDYKIPDTKDKIKLTVSGVYDEFKALKKTKKYKELIEDGVKVVFKPKITEDKKSSSQERNTNNKISGFNEILYDIVKKEKNTYLNEAYEIVVNNNITT